MADFIEMLKTAWPGMLLVAGIVGAIIGWIATRESRKRTNEAQARTIAVYEQTIKAKDGLAFTLAESTARQIEALNNERKESDRRHEDVIKEYRDKLHDVRNQLQQKTSDCGIHMAELADLRARTDFKPVMEFQQTWYAESREVHTKLLDVMAVITPLLSEVSLTLKELKLLREK